MTGAPRAKALFLYLSAMLGLVSGTASAHAACQRTQIEGARYVVCEFKASDSIELFLRDDAGANIGQFDRVRKTLAARGRQLVFAMNAGMYHDDRSPVGLYVENGREVQRISTANGWGNFSLKPNGVFFITDDGAGVLETDQYIRSKIKPRFATQSGPMLVIDGKLHHRFLKDATSRYRRNGVGVDGDRVVFAISDDAVTFHQFGRAFRDVFKTPNALYLDGSISRLFAPNLRRYDFGFPMGPIVGVSIPSQNDR
ncbi:hypothetical protein APY04_3401 [Hyphomicrobium sulfonivorans]|uniref:Phosphodiester glycosidase domain-containing protein n=2 Tax=Hyphomicrobium sulfonivorans TaxID=121290 RepID=A0A120CT57_HYPSL|nr:phosphodiester glycosidase family protein [Hyphomicrobium sulfonivorans]KWT64137.1 hypothetical protein APY04_3401 [Hyphomicrobium sulfonivorans]